MNKMITAFAAAFLLVVPITALAQSVPAPGPTTTLEGSRADWTAEPGLAGSVVLRSPKYGVNATVYRNFRFRLEQWVWDGRQLLPLAAPAGCPAPVPALEHPLLAKLRAAGVDPDRLAGALKP